MQEFREQYLAGRERMHPELERLVKDNQTTISNNNAFPQIDAQGNRINFEELSSYKRFIDIVAKVKHYTGVQDLSNPSALMQLQGMLMRTFQEIIPVQRQYKSQLERLSIELVVREEEIPNGAFQFDSKLVGMGEISKEKFQQDSKEPSQDEIEEQFGGDNFEGEEFETPNDSFDKEKQKRRFTNALIQGSAKKGHYMFELVRNELNQMHPNLSNMYGIVMSINDLMYWMMPDEQMKRMAGNSVNGEEEIDTETEPPTIKAKGILFPILVHELIKGVYDVFGTHGFPDDPKSQQMIMDSTDTLTNEMWDLRLGGFFWERLNNMFPISIFEEGNKHIKHYLFARLVALETNEFNKVFQDIMMNNSDGKKFVEDMIYDIKKDMNERALNELLSQYDYESNKDEEEGYDLFKKGGQTKNKKGDIGKSGTQYGYTLKEWEKMAEKNGLLVSPTQWWKSQEGKKYKDFIGRNKTIGQHSGDKEQQMNKYGYYIANGMDLGSDIIPASAKKYVQKNHFTKYKVGGSIKNKKDMRIAGGMTNEDIIFEYPKDSNGRILRWINIGKGNMDVSSKTKTTGRINEGHNLIVLKSETPNKVDYHILVDYLPKENKIYNVKGKFNTKPSPKYESYINDLFRILDVSKNKEMNEYAKGGSVKAIKKKAENLLEESISYRWVNTDMGSGWSFELESPLDRSVFNILEHHTYLDEFSPDDMGIEDYDDLSKEEQDYYYEDWKEELFQSTFEAFKEKCKKHLDDFIEYIQQAQEYQDEMNEYAKGGFVSKAELVWKKLSSSDRMKFLQENFTPQITPRSQEILVGKAYNFLPKEVKITLASKYADVEQFVDGGGIGETPYSFDVEATKSNGDFVKQVRTIYSDDNISKAKAKLKIFLSEKLKYTNIKITNGRKGHELLNNKMAKGGGVGDEWSYIRISGEYILKKGEKQVRLGYLKNTSFNDITSLVEELNSNPFENFAVSFYLTKTGASQDMSLFDSVFIGYETEIDEDDRLNVFGLETPIAEYIGKMKKYVKEYLIEKNDEYAEGGEIKVNRMTKQDYIDAFQNRVEKLIEELKKEGKYDENTFDFLYEIIEKEGDGGFTDIEETGFWLSSQDVDGYDRLAYYLLIDKNDVGYRNYTEKVLSNFYFGKPMKIEFVLKTSGDTELALEDELQKIKLLSNKIDFNKVIGVIDYEKTTDNTDLYFYKDIELVMSLNGDWDETTEELDTIIDVNGETAYLNYHPLDSMGGVNMQQLKKNINEAFKELNTYSAVVSIEGYEEYAENVEGLENAKSVIQDIKGNTRFQVLKGSSVGIGKRVDSSRVVEEYAKGGGVGDEWSYIRISGEYILKKGEKQVRLGYLKNTSFNDITSLVEELNSNPFENFAVSFYLTKTGASQDMSLFDSVFIGYETEIDEDDRLNVFGLETPIAEYIGKMKKYVKEYLIEKNDEYAGGGEVNWNGEDFDYWYSVATEDSNESKKELNKLSKKDSVNYDDVTELALSVRDDINDIGDFYDYDEDEWVDNDAMQMCYAIAEKMLEQAGVKVKYAGGGGVGDEWSYIRISGEYILKKGEKQVRLGYLKNTSFNDITSLVEELNSNPFENFAVSFYLTKTGASQDMSLFDSVFIGYETEIDEDDRLNVFGLETPIAEYIGKMKKYVKEYLIEKNDEYAGGGEVNWNGEDFDYWYSVATEDSNESKKELNKLSKKDSVNYDDVTELALSVRDDINDIGDFYDYDEDEWVDNDAMQMCYAIAEKMLEQAGVKVKYAGGGGVGDEWSYIRISGEYILKKGEKQVRLGYLKNTSFNDITSLVEELNSNPFENFAVSFYLTKTGASQDMSLFDSVFIGYETEIDEDDRLNVFGLETPIAEYIGKMKKYVKEYLIEKNDEYAGGGEVNWNGEDFDYWYSVATEDSNESKKELNKLSKKDSVNYDDVTELALSVRDDINDIGDFYDYDEDEWVDNDAMQMCYAIAEKMLEQAGVKVKYAGGGGVGDEWSYIRISGEYILKKGEKQVRLGYLKNTSFNDITSLVEELNSNPFENFAVSFYLTKTGASQDMSLFDSVFIGYETEIDEDDRLNVFGLETPIAEYIGKMKKYVKEYLIEKNDEYAGGGEVNWNGEDFDYWYSVATEDSNESKKELNKLSKKDSVNYDDVTELALSVRDDINDIGDFYDYDEDEWVDNDAMQMCYAIAEKMLEQAGVKVKYAGGGEAGNKKQNKKEKRFSVWVGGVEVNDYYLTEKEAKDLAFEYEDDDYDDVVIADNDEYAGGGEAGNKKQNKKEKRFSVWVGGVEVNDYYLTEKEAKDLAFEYEDDDYDDVVIADNDEYAEGGGVGNPSKKEMLDYLNMYFDNYSELRTIAIEEDNILTRKMLNSLDNEELEMAYDDAKYEIKADTQFDNGGGVGMEKSYNNPENAIHVLHIDNQNWYLEKIDSTHFYMSNDPNFRGMANHIGQHKGELYYDEVKQWLKDTQFDNGGGVGWNENALEELQEFEGDDEIQITTHSGNLFYASNDNAEYIVFKNYDDAYDYAYQMVNQDLVDNPEYFNQNWLSNFVDIDGAKYYLTEVYDEWNYSYANDIKMESDSKYSNRLISEMVDAGLMDDEDAESEDAESTAISLMDDFVEYMTNSQIDEGRGGLDYYENNFGQEQTMQMIIENNLIDIDEATEGAISEDGVAHFISSYDGNEIELPSGYYAYRTN
jgi:hypothetical protein